MLPIAKGTQWKEHWQSCNLGWTKDERTPPWFYRDGTNVASRELLLELNGFPWKRVNHPLLFDRERKPKPAFESVIEALTP